MSILGEKAVAEYLQAQGFTKYRDHPVPLPFPLVYVFPDILQAKLREGPNPMIANVAVLLEPTDLKPGHDSGRLFRKGWTGYYAIDDNMRLEFVDETMHTNDGGKLVRLDRLLVPPQSGLALFPKIPSA